jgi:hypothetical protein
MLKLILGQIDPNCQVACERAEAGFQAGQGLEAFYHNQVKQM